MAAVMEYNYDVEATLVYGNNSLVFDENTIKSIILNHDFDNKNMPIIYLQISIAPDQYNIMVQNRSNASIIFTLYKYDATSNSQIKKKYISDSFSYMMTSDPNYNESLNTGSNQRFSENKNNVEESLKATSYFNGYIALVKEESLNANKQLNNGIFRNCNLISLIHRFTKHMTMVIEPLDPQNNTTIDQIIIPPVDTVTKVLEYIDSEQLIYPTGYRYFRDFDKTYLLSNSGNAVDLHDGAYSKVFIEICDPLEVIESGNAMEIDTANKAYIIKINANDTSIKVDQSVDRSYNSIMSIDSDGQTTNVDLNVEAHSDSTQKVQVTRSGTETITKSKYMRESTATMLSITKSNIDSSILTPNKEYIVKNYKNNAQYNGRYILSYKKEVLARDGNYVISTLFGLRKVSDS